VRRGSRVGLSYNGQYSTRRSGSGLTYGIRDEDGSFLRWGDCNIPHRKKSVQSQDILRQSVPNLVGFVLGPVCSGQSSFDVGCYNPPTLRTSRPRL